MKIALTGGIGCGKSTVLGLLKNHGWPCISADLIVHKLLSEDNKLVESIVERFGDTILNKNKVIDRSLLAETVFLDETRLHWLESLLHPKVSEVWRGFLEEHSDVFACVEIPLLFEKRLEKEFDFVVSVTCSDFISNERLSKKGLSQSDFLLRRNQQFQNSIKEELSNFVLANDGSTQFLDIQINKLIHTLEHNKC